MMDFTREQLEKIISEAPEGAVYYHHETGCYYTKTYLRVGRVEVKLMRYNYESCILICDLAEKLQEMKVQESKQAEIDNTAQQVEGLSKEGEVEWKNGDAVKTPLGYGALIGESIRKPDFWWVEIEDEECAHDIHKSDLSKPPTPEQKQQQINEQNRLEAAYDLYCDWCKIEGHAKFSLDGFMGTVQDKAVWLHVVDKTNYRKDESI